MIRKRIPERDDRTILQLVRSELLPYTQRILPDVQLDRTMLKQRLSGTTTYMCSRNGVEPLGFVSCLIEDKTLVIDMIAISRRAQGRGFGSVLMNTAERLGQRRGCEEALLYVDRANTGAQRFYKKKGYAQVGYIEHVQCFEMRKRLVRPR